MTPRRARARGGFTLIELLAVVGLLGVILFVVTPNLDNVSPRSRLRAAARRIASTIELAQGQAIASGKELVLAYDLDKRTFWLILPPKEDEKVLNATPDPNVPPPPLPDIEHGPRPEVESSQNGSSSPRGPLSFAGRETFGEDLLPEDVILVSVHPASGQEKTSGQVYVTFSSLGNDGSHSVFLKLKGATSTTTVDDTTLSVRFNALTRTVDFANEKLEWKTIDGQ